MVLMALDSRYSVRSPVKACHGTSTAAQTLLYGSGLSYVIMHQQLACVLTSRFSSFSIPLCVR
jgi:hypothetical protein